MEGRITYFEDLRPENTEVTFALARERAAALGIGKLVLASTTGATAQKAMDYFYGLKLIVVPHQYDLKRAENRSWRCNQI